jgi:hypothetical protein
MIARAGAFSLPEVTISMGIVAVLMLPALAMLAGGGSMQSLAQDRESAGRLAREITTTIRPTGSGGSFEVPFSIAEPLNLDLPEVGAPTTVFAAMDQEGRFLREISEAEFIGGTGPAGDPLHIVRLRFSRSAHPSLLDLDLSVQRPAMAAETSRSKETFQTRLGIP